MTPTAKPPSFRRTGDDLIAATDGTVKDGRGGAAVVIHSNETPGILHSVLPVDGHPTHTTSYRTELAGILAALIIINMILQKQRGDFSQLQGTIHCDNKAAVNQYNALEGDLPYSIKQANSTDSDILQELRYWKRKIPSGISAK